MIEILIQQKSEIMVLIYKEWGQTGNHPHAVTLVMIVAGTQENEALEKKPNVIITLDC